LESLRSSPDRILLESYVDDNWEIFEIRADGTARRNLTNSRDVHELYPQASPDGRRICFLADVQRDGETVRSVYYMNADGTDRTWVAEGVREPCWSPDGTKIAFCKQEFARFNVTDYVSKGLFIYDLKTREIHEHPNAQIHHLYVLNWAPGGKWLVATVHGGMGYSHGILAIEIDGSRVVDLKIGGCRPCVSDDGRGITWSRDDHTICVADLDLQSDMPVVSNVRVVDRHETAHLYHPDFSPDGRLIVYSMGPGGRVQAQGPGTHTQVAEMIGVRGRWDLYVKPISGEGAALRLTADEALSNKEPEWIRGRAAGEAAQ
jgi:Tol biopolymer transport system component